jgi:hypothetical protein
VTNDLCRLSCPPDGDRSQRSQSTRRFSSYMLEIVQPVTMIRPRKLIGYWRSDDGPTWPDPADFVDEQWDRSERDTVAFYLMRGTAVEWSELGFSDCRMCGKMNGSDEYTDGTYVWPEGLSHYVRDHAVRLPTEVVEHILRRQENSLAVDRSWWRSVQPDW